MLVFFYFFLLLFCYFLLNVFYYIMEIGGGFLMNFGIVLDKLLNREVFGIRRDCWDVAEYVMIQDDLVGFRRCFLVLCNEGGCCVPWTPCQLDCFADDWRVIEL